MLHAWHNDPSNQRTGSSPSRALVPPAASDGSTALAVAGGGSDEDDEYDVEAITEMQTKLDEELAEMFAQLKVCDV